MTNVIVYQANNGDVFFKHELNAKENLKQEDWKSVIKQSKLKIIENDIVNVEAVEENGTTSYYEGDKFIGNAHIHVKDNYSMFRDMVYLNIVNEDKKRETERLLNAIFN